MKVLTNVKSGSFESLNLKKIDFKLNRKLNLSRKLENLVKIDLDSFFDLATRMNG